VPISVAYAKTLVTAVSAIAAASLSLPSNAQGGSTAPPAGCEKLICGEYILVDCFSANDGPLSVYSRSSGKLLGDCGYWSRVQRKNELLCTAIDHKSCVPATAPNSTVERDARKNSARPSP